MCCACMWDMGFVFWWHIRCSDRLCMWLHVAILRHCSAVYANLSAWKDCPPLPPSTVSTIRLSQSRMRVWWWWWNCVPTTHIMNCCCSSAWFKHALRHTVRILLITQITICHSQAHVANSVSWYLHRCLCLCGWELGYFHLNICLFISSYLSL